METITRDQTGNKQWPIHGKRTILKQDVKKRFYLELDGRIVPLISDRGNDFNFRWTRKHWAFDELRKYWDRII